MTGEVDYNIAKARIIREALAQCNLQIQHVIILSPVDHSEKIT
jgi:hypothetical protein